MSSIKVIGLTGGPCAGKSTGLAFLKQKLEELGCMVIITPESPTDLMLRGLTPHHAPVLFFQREAGERMLFDLSQAKRFAGEYQKVRPEQKVVILCDRGIADLLPYTGEEEYTRFLDMWRLGTHQEMKQRLYDCAVHMVTAADGAEEYYTLLNNKARFERSLASAREVDGRTQKAWIGHQHFFVVDNSTPFEQKLQRVLRHICNEVGLPLPLECEKKFLVGAWNEGALEAIVPRVGIDIAQAYTPQKGERVRERTVDGVTSYFHTVKYPAPGGGNVEYERLISKDEFDRFVTQYDLHERFLRKRRHSFVANGRHFDLDVFSSGGLILLECELPSMDERPVIPDFIKVKEEVTDDPSYSNYEIWKRMFG